MKLLVTGITGHSGKWFLNNLETNNFNGEVNVVVRESSKTDILDNSSLKIVKHIGDLDDKKFLNKVTQNVDTVIQIAHIKYSLNILEAAVQNNVDWFIGVHTTGIYSNFKVASEEYIAIEKELEKYRDDINITLLRPTMIYGSSMDQNMFKLVKFIDKSPVFPLFGLGKNLMQPVHAKDLGKAYYNVLMTPEITKNKSYILSGKYPITYKELVKTVAAELNSHVKIINIPIKLSYYSALVGNRLIPKFPINEEQVLRMKEDKNFPHLSAKRDFGYNPVSFKEGIKEEVEEYLSMKRGK